MGLVSDKKKKNIDKVYIDGVTHFYKDIPMRDPLSARLGPKISLFQCLQYEWARNILITKHFYQFIYRSP